MNESHPDEKASLLGSGGGLNGLDSSVKSKQVRPAVPYLNGVESPAYDESSMNNVDEFNFGAPIDHRKVSSSK